MEWNGTFSRWNPLCSSELVYTNHSVLIQIHIRMSSDIQYTNNTQTSIAVLSLRVAIAVPSAIPVVFCCRVHYSSISKSSQAKPIS